MIHIEKCIWRGKVAASLDKGSNAPVLALRVPVAHAFFDQPHAVDVFQEAGTALQASFIADVLFEGSVAEAGAIKDRTYERPGSRADEGAIVTRVRDAGDGRARIMTGRCNQLRVSEFGKPREFSLELTDDGAGRHKFRCLAQVQARRSKNLRRPGAVSGTEKLRVRCQRELRYG